MILTEIKAIKFCNCMFHFSHYIFLLNNHLFHYVNLIFCFSEIPHPGSHINQGTQTIAYFDSVNIKNLSQPQNENVCLNHQIRRYLHRQMRNCLLSNFITNFVITFSYFLRFKLYFDQSPAGYVVSLSLMSSAIAYQSLHLVYLITLH